MITEPILAEGIAKGLVSAGQAEALRSLARQRRDHDPAPPDAPDDEALRFVTGFADIFVAIGIVLFLGAGAYLLGPRVGSGASAAIIAATAWALAEFFARRKRMALPSILLLLVFVTAGFVSVAVWFGPPGASVAGWGWPFVLSGAGRGDPSATAASALAAAGLAAAHYWRFQVPITAAAGAAALVMAAMMVLFVAAPQFAAGYFNTLLFAAGLALFAAAMRVDGTDPERRTRRTDIAFWLHLTAAPLIVHSVFRIIGLGAGPLSPGFAPVVIGVFILLGAVAVLVDRRALLVSGLVYAGTALGVLISTAGFGGLTVPVTILTLGAFVLALSAGWAPLRRVVLGRLPEGIAAQLPRPAAA